MLPVFYCSQWWDRQDRQEQSCSLKRGAPDPTDVAQDFYYLGGRGLRQRPGPAGRKSTAHWAPHLSLEEGISFYASPGSRTTLPHSSPTTDFSRVSCWGPWLFWDVGSSVTMCDVEGRGWQTLPAHGPVLPKPPKHLPMWAHGAWAADDLDVLEAKENETPL